MQSLATRRARRTTDTAANSPSAPYEPGAGEFYEWSATVDFASTATLAPSAAIDVAAPAGVTLPEGSAVQVGVPAAFDAGLFVSAKVKSGGAAVTVQAFNGTAGTVNAASGTFTFRVRK